jgi:type I restriction-modification system DNA methylase subunit
MSATGRALTKRREYDFYETPTWATELIIKEIVFPNDPSVLEPCCGSGAIVKVIEDRANATVVQFDIRDGEEFDFLNMEFGCRFDFSITNPPYSLAREFVEHSLRLANCTVMLLRLNFLASSKRKEFWQKHPPTAIHVLTKRPSFTGKGSDATDYGWFVWDYTGRQKRGIHWL